MTDDDELIREKLIKAGVDPERVTEGLIATTLLIAKLGDVDYDYAVGQIYCAIEEKRQ